MSYRWMLVIVIILVFTSVLTVRRHSHYSAPEIAPPEATAQESAKHETSQPQPKVSPKLPSELPGSPLEFLMVVPSLAGAQWREIGPFLVSKEIKDAPSSSEDETPFAVNFRDVYFSNVSVSPDGKRIMAFADPQLYWRHAVITEIATGNTYIPEPSSLSKGDHLLPSWDPREPDYVFVVYDMGGGARELWRYRHDGQNLTQISKPGENVSYASPTPDGAWLVMSLRPNPIDLTDKAHTYFLRAYDKYRKQKKADFSFPFLVLSPNMAYCTGDGTAFFERTTQTEKIVFGKEQLAFAVPSADQVGSARSAACWLPDSSGTLINVHIPSNPPRIPERWEVWQVNVDGQYRRLSKNARVIANSCNGRHWLFEVGGKFYTASTTTVLQGTGKKF